MNCTKTDLGYRCQHRPGECGPEIDIKTKILQALDAVRTLGGDEPDLLRMAPNVAAAIPELAMDHLETIYGVRVVVDYTMERDTYLVTRDVKYLGEHME